MSTNFLKQRSTVLGEQVSSPGASCICRWGVPVYLRGPGLKHARKPRDKIRPKHPHRLSGNDQEGLRATIAYAEEGDIVSDSHPALIQILVIGRDEIFQFISVEMVMETLLKPQQLDGWITVRDIPPFQAT